jgi:hypothetical protein
LKKIAASGKNIIRCYQKQTKDIVAEKTKLQTCLTSLKDGLEWNANFVTIRKAVKKWLHYR